MRYVASLVILALAGWLAARFLGRRGRESMRDVERWERIRAFGRKRGGER